MNKWIDIFMPGRLCLFGEHSDWAASYRSVNKDINKGYAIVLGINKGIYLKARKSNELIYCFKNKKISIDINSIQLDKDGFYDYVIASAKIMIEKFHIDRAEIVCTKMDLPIKKGLASSAAICMGIIRIFNQLYELNLPIEEEMELAYEAENLLGSKCGRLDQLCAYGKGIRMAVFGKGDIELHSISCNKNLYYLLVDLNGDKNTKKILKDLNNEYPYARSASSKRLFYALGSGNQNIVEKVSKKIEGGDIYSIGRYMNEAQVLFDKYVSPFSQEELSAPKLHDLLNFVSDKKSVLGAKGVGAQGDGMAQLLLCDKESLKDIAQMIHRKYGYKVYEVICESNSMNAVIPIAGYGTRLNPFTKFVDKAALPIYADKKIYPAIYLIIKELDKANIKRVDIVIREEQQNLINTLTNLIESEKLKIKVNTSIQQIRGFGGAISSSAFAKSEEYFLVCLGDYIYKSKCIGDCTNQLINAWIKYKEAFVTIKPIQKNETMNYGVVYGEWIEENILKVEKIIEKPSADYAEKNLMVKCNETKNIYGIFGQYLLNNKISKLFPKKAENNIEIGLTEYLNLYLERYPIYAVLINGESFDLGNPEDYYKSFGSYGKE